jgi:hypothetical protein
MNIPTNYKKFFNHASAITLFCLLIIFFQSRNSKVYRDKKLKLLKYNLVGLLPGGNNIYTNIDNHTIFSDFNNIIDKYSINNFTIVPGFAGYWPASDFRIPLSADSIQRYDVAIGHLHERVKADITKLINEGGIVILQKYDGRLISKQKNPITRFSYYPIVLFIKNNFFKKMDTKYFEIYA